MTIINIAVIDLETTGTEATDEVVEIGRTDVRLDLEAGRQQIGKPTQSLVKPTRSIPALASAVHGITDDDVAGAPSWEDARQAFVTPDVDFFVAHNAAFEEIWLPSSIRHGKPLVCTYKAALRVWPAAPAHSNQVLRYWLKLQIADFGRAHTAGFDTLVTAHILERLLKEVSIEVMAGWSLDPPLMPVCPLKKFKGQPWADVDGDYLDWICSDRNDLDADVKWNARREIDRRRGAVRQAYVTAAAYAATLASSITELMAWFTGEATRRFDLGIEKGSAEYDQIIAACAARKAQLTEGVQA